MSGIIDFLESLFRDPTEGVVRTHIEETLIIPPVIKLEDYSVDGDRLSINMPADVRRYIHDWTTYEIQAAVIAENPDLVSDIRMKNAPSLGFHDTDGTFVGSSQASLISAIAISKQGAWKEDGIGQLLRSMEKHMQDRMPTTRMVFKMESVSMPK